MKHVQQTREETPRFVKKKFSSFDFGKELMQISLCGGGENIEAENDVLIPVPSRMLNVVVVSFVVVAFKSFLFTLY